MTNISNDDNDDDDDDDDKPMLLTHPEQMLIFCRGSGIIFSCSI